MKSFLEFVSCCGPSVLSAVPTAPPPTEETQSIMPLSCARKDPSPCTKRRKRTGSGSVSTAQWKPSLNAISEDTIVSIVAGKPERSVRSEKKLERKTGSTGRIRARDRIIEDEYRRAPVPAIIPAFSPATFLF